MLSLHRIYYILLELLFKFLVKSTVIPSDPCAKVGLDQQQHILYVLPCRSITDLFTLHIQCLKRGLPDPLKPLNIDGVILPRYIFIHDNPSTTTWYIKKSHSISLFHNYLLLHRSNPNLNLKLVLVSVMFGRSPGKKQKNHKSLFQINVLNIIEKFFAILWLGRDSIIYFSRPFSFRYMATEHKNDTFIAQKLARVARIHFARQRLVATGPRLLARQDLFNKLLNSEIIKKVVEDEMRNKNISIERVQQNTIKLIKEIAADFSYEAIRLFDRILSWSWNRLYQGLCVNNAERVRQLAEDGHEIVYTPCHRSHMDYLLISYILYHHGLVPPHIAAGINLNFWPAGSVLRRLGAFFIRRQFKGNKLYSAIFREYLKELFNHGYSVEYFIEGGRSRTGRLLEPKTGTLTMTIQAILRGGINRPITLIPIYIGYERVIEVTTYDKELRGSIKEQESLWQMLRGLRKLGNLGHVYVNFGDPIPLVSWLSHQIPHWRASIDPIETQRPNWLMPVVNEIAFMIMTRINNAAAANAINLCSSVLLASYRNSIKRQHLLVQLKCYLELLRNVPYSPDITIPDLTPEELLIHALTMNYFNIKHDGIDDTVYVSPNQAILMTYYRNNVQHLFVIPSLLASIICFHPGIKIVQLKKQIKLIYPLLKAELFMRYNNQELLLVIDNIITELKRQKLVDIKEEIKLYPEKTSMPILQLLAANISEILQRYVITFSILRANLKFNRIILEKESRIIAQKLSLMNGINAPEFFDKAVFSTLVTTLRAERYISDNGSFLNDKIINMYTFISKLIDPNILRVIEDSILLAENNQCYNDCICQNSSHI